MRVSLRGNRSKQLICTARRGRANPSLNISAFAVRVYVKMYFLERICKAGRRLVLSGFILECHTNTFKCGEWI